MSARAIAPALEFISAGAGSGKTYRLTALLEERLLEGSIRPAGVMAVTFTNRAAMQLREKVRARLLKSGRPALAIEIGQARIGTVNGICGALLARFAFEARRPVEQRVLEPDTARVVLDEALDEAVETCDLARLLSAAHRLCLEKGARNGDPIPWRKALADIVDTARANGIDAQQLAGFGRENARRLLAAFPRASTEDLDAPLLAAVQMARDTIRAAVDASAAPKKKTLTALQCLEESLQELGSGDLRWAGWSRLAKLDVEVAMRSAAQPVLNAAIRHASHPRLHADLTDYLSVLFELAAGALEGYEARKRQMSAVDFVDQERLLLELLDHPAVAATLGEELELLLVDEFQDTSPIQLALFLRLSRLAKQTICVGDVKQAIYGFRGGDATLMRAVLAALPALGASASRLEFSYRSRPPLVWLANELFATAFPGLAATDVALKPERQESEPNAPALEEWRLDGRAASAQYPALASGLAALHAEGYHILDPESREPRPMRWGDAGVLALSNSTVQNIASALSAAGIPVATQQPGLLATPEAILALACLRRLNDASDTLASAEIIALAECADPDTWLLGRLAFIDGGGAASAWRETGPAASPLLEAIGELRAQHVLLSPREAVEAVLTRCGLARCVLQWQGSPERARRRLANLDGLLAQASQYEEDCRAAGEAPTLSGLLLRFARLAERGADELAPMGLNAVSVLTYHAAKGLEWPVVILTGLDGDLRDAVWNQVRAASHGDFDARAPLAQRFVRYWPWPYGAHDTVPGLPPIDATNEASAQRQAAEEEYKRLLYVGATRARDLLVIARPAAQTGSGPWLQLVPLTALLPAGDGQPLVLSGGQVVPFRRRRLAAAGVANAVGANGTQAGDEPALTWFEPAAAFTVKAPLVVSPSHSAGQGARVAEESRFCERLRIEPNADPVVFGEALHTCIAADLVAPGGLTEEEIAAIFACFDLATTVSATALMKQLSALRAWLDARWPGAQRLVEVPITQRLAGGQQLAGRIDLLLATATGWILIDHKASPAGGAGWQALAGKYGPQLAAYRAAIEAVTGKAVLESWLALPVAGAGVRVGSLEE